MWLALRSEPFRGRFGREQFWRSTRQRPLTADGFTASQISSSHHTVRAPNRRRLMSLDFRLETESSRLGPWNSLEHERKTRKTRCQSVSIPSVLLCYVVFQGGRKHPVLSVFVSGECDSSFPGVRLQIRHEGSMRHGSTTGHVKAMNVRYSVLTNKISFCTLQTPPRKYGVLN